MSNRFTLTLFSAASILFISGPAHTQQNLVVNSTFAAVGANGQPSGWEPFWSRTIGGGQMSIDATANRNGGPALHVEHTGKLDWSVGQTGRIPVHSGEIISISGWVKSESQQDAQISIVTRDAAEKFQDWSYGVLEVGGSHGWMFYHRKLVTPVGCSTIQFRMIGNSAAKLWLDSPTLSRAGTVGALTGGKSGFRHGQSHSATLRCKYGAIGLAALLP